LVTLRVENSALSFRYPEQQQCGGNDHPLDNWIDTTTKQYDIESAVLDPPVAQRRTNLIEHVANSRADATLSALPRSAGFGA
jgi:hypothetical protein